VIIKETTQTVYESLQQKIDLSAIPAGINPTIYARAVADIESLTKDINKDNSILAAERLLRILEVLVQTIGKQQGIYYGARTVTASS
jgi:hypothetical protein